MINSLSFYQYEFALIDSRLDSMRGDGRLGARLQGAMFGIILAGKVASCIHYDNIYYFDELDIR